MKTKLPLLIFSLVSSSLLSQSPGGVGTGNLRGWFDGSVGITLTGGVVSAWTDRAGVGNASQATAGERPSVSTAGINYNDVLSFDGSNDNLDLADRMATGVTGVSAYAVARQVATTGDTWGSVFNGQANGPLWTGGGYGLVALNSGSTQHGFYVRDYNTKGVGFAVTNGVTFLQSGVWNGTTANAVQAFKDGSSAGTVAYTPGSVGDNGSTWIGSGDGSATNWCFNGLIAEIAVFNTAMTVANNNKIMSYFAIKYGLTMATSYTNSAGTTVFSTAAPYNTQIFGITRDDGSGLTQKQSKSTDDTTRIYISTLNASNAGNAGTFAANLSHVMVGANNGKMCARSTTSAEIPSGFGINSRLEREWKVTNTNFGGTFSMDFKLSSCAKPASVSTAHLRLLLDDDGNFAAGTNTAVASGAGGITITYANPVITVSGISSALLASGATTYMTIGSTSGSTPLPIKLRDFYALKGVNNNSIYWESETETDFSHYELERSKDGENFKSIGSVLPQQTTNTQDVRSYKHNDDNYLTPVSYYRLKMVDMNGDVEYSNVISVVREPGVLDYRIFPNPTSKGFYIKGSDATQGAVTLEVSDLMGKKLHTQTLNAGETAEGKQYIDLSQLGSGIYLINVTNESGLSYKEKLVLEK